MAGVREMAAGKRQVTIEKDFFLMAFGRDVDYETMESQIGYLDCESGEVIWIFGDDEDAEMVVNIPADDNRRERERIEADPERFLEIPGLDHGDHHDILRAFLRSSWCDDEWRLENAAAAYSGSIGRWKRHVRDDDAVHAFYDFQEVCVAKLAEEWLDDNGIITVWK